MMFKTKGGVKGFLNNVKKNCRSGGGWLPLVKSFNSVTESVIDKVTY